MPALAVATSVAGERRQFQLGCDEDARFRIASITKPMTASLAVQLLDLDESTESGRRTSASGTCCRTSRATAARSATSRASARATTRSGGSRRAAVGRTARPARRRVVVRQHGYWLAGWLAARQNGSTYEEALQEHVLGPAGLDEATFGSPSLEGTGPDGAAAATIRAPAALRAGSSRPQRRRRPLRRLAAAAAVDERAAGAAREAAGWRLRARLLRRARGGDRHLGPPRLLRRLPVLLLLVPSRDAWFVGLTNSGLGSQALREVEDAWFEELLGAQRRVARPSSSSRRRSPGSAAPTRTRT